MPILRGRRTIHHNKISLATLLSGLVALSVLLTLTILLIASYQSKKRAIFDTTLTLNFSNATKMSQTMDSLFSSMRSSLQYTAGMYSGNLAMSEEERYAQLELMRHSSNYFNSIVVVDENGIFRSFSPQGAGTVGKPITTDASKEALESKKPYLSKPYTSSTGRLIVFMSEPLFDKEGVYRGIIGGTLYLQENNILTMIFGSNRIDELGSYYYVVGSDGHLLFHPDRSRLGEDVNANAVVQKLLKGQSGQQAVVNTRGVALLAGYSIVPANNWGVVVVSPISVVYEQLNRHIKAMLLYTLAPFLLLMLTAVWLARKLARPFVALTNLISQIGEEDSELPAAKNHWNREADLLTRTTMLALADMKRDRAQLTQAAMTDPLTGLMNRRTMELKMNLWLEAKTPFSMIVMDIDKFKSVNDTFGHQAGDDVLKHLAGIVTQSTRSHDVCCRFGGEEFVVLLPYISAKEAFFVAERIRQTMEASGNPVGTKVTLSLGVAHCPIHADTGEALFHLADQALYAAKGGGRNRTVMAQIRERKLT
ncbi:diguanylate cyclase [Paenibacillus sp. MBLB4367]|uniref:sensor domain-containing diguanylate cyclase n=1 Tax=Paenibacillus sp. MBLB4367 TaxID=3384767 RepID=UPI00390806EE